MAPKMSKHVPRLTAGEFLELMDEVIYPEDNTTPARPLSTSRWRPALLTHPGGFERLLKRLLLSQAASRTSRVERRGLGPRFEHQIEGRLGSPSDAGEPALLDYLRESLLTCLSTERETDLL